jgi:tetratricopeptide (TPR) repeat protein
LCRRRRALSSIGDDVLLRRSSIDEGFLPELMAPSLQSRPQRLRVLFAVALALAGIAGVLRLSFGRHVSHQEAAAPSAPPLNSVPPPVDDRPQRIMRLAQHLATNPGDREARLRLAQLYFQLQQYAQSLAELHVLEHDDPKDAEIPFRRAVVLKYAGRLEEAETAVRHALTLSPHHELAQAWLGQIHLDQGRFRDARDDYQRCLAAHPNSYPALLGETRAADALFQLKHPITLQELIGPAEKAVKLDPNNPEGLALLARMKFAYGQGSKDWDEAEGLAQRAAQLDPENPQPYITLAQISLARPPTPEHLQKVVEYGRLAAMKDPQDARPPYLIGRVSLSQNKVDQAIQELERSLSLRALPETVTQLAVAYRRAGNVERAKHYAALYQRYSEMKGRRDALMGEREREPREVQHYYALAELYLEAGQPDVAEQWLRAAQQVRARDPRREKLAARVKAMRDKGSDGPLLPLQ